MCILLETCCTFTPTNIKTANLMIYVRNFMILLPFVAADLMPYVR